MSEDDEVDDTAMTPEEFRAALAQGVPVKVVKSREEYEAELAAIDEEDVT